MFNPSFFQRVLGCGAVIGRQDNWEQFFDLSKPALKFSFVLQFLTLPAFYLTAKLSSIARATALEQTALEIALTPVIIIGLIYLLSFSAVAYILALVFDRQDRLRPWIIVRHWCIFLLAWLCTASFWLFTLGVLPLAGAYGVTFAAYMGLLIIDIRLAQRIVGFDLGAAVLTGCLISITGLSLLLTSLSQFVQ